METGPKLIRKNSKVLRKISFGNESRISSKDLWTAVAECPQINQIDLVHVDIQSNDLEAFWEACSKVETLTLLESEAHLEFDGSQATKSLPRFPKLKDLYLGMEDECLGQSQVAVIKNAPNLKSLDWQICQADIFPREGYLQVMSERMCPQLESLTMTTVRPMTDDEIALSIDAMTNTRVLDFGRGRFSDNAYRSLLSRHTATLRVFIAHGCPSLEVLEADGICGSDLVQIEESELSSANPVREERFFQLWDLHQEQAFRQLSRLTRLDELNIKNQSDFRSESLDLRLESRGGSLQRLASLKRLKSFNFTNTIQELSRWEIGWMFKHWPRLSTLEGTFSMDAKKDDKLRDYTNERLRDRQD
ncbi:hypothetical protein BGZ80_010502 [Entomortierella chlamydospora]|uniref:F-box domain protein n=1 Tax=Entomortierella chlamydospora TaxID=101097 RepID=A0A9P6MVS1_9FUNG|nr:hypothetical protein BGZ80_010502 [Entomortierella chlamydospora]